MTARTHKGRAFKMLTVVDEFSRECLAIDAARRLSSEDGYLHTTQAHLLETVLAVTRLMAG